MSLVDLVTIIWAIPGVWVTILVGLAAAVVVGRWLAGRFGGSATLAVLALASWVVLVVLTLVPDGVEAWRAGSWAWVVRTAPGNVARCVTSWDGAVSLAASTLDGRANVLLFAVPALLGGVWLRRPLLVGVALTAQSALTELLQALLGSGSCQASDWIANTTGAAFGAATAWAAITVSAWLAARSDRPDPVTEP